MRWLMAKCMRSVVQPGRKIGCSGRRGMTRSTGTKSSARTNRFSRNQSSPTAVVPRTGPSRSGGPTPGRGPRSCEGKGAGGVLDEEPGESRGVHAPGAQAGHHVHEQVVVAVAAVLHERGLVGDIVRHEDLVAVAGGDEG